MTGQLHPRDARMRDYSKGRSGYDRALVAVAATFMAVAATAAPAQADPPRKSAAELAIDAAIPRPEPANVPPPTASDFKLDTTASVPDAVKAIDKAIDRAQEKTQDKPQDNPQDNAVATKPADAAVKKDDTATTTPAVPSSPTAPATSVTATPATEPAKEIAKDATPKDTVKAASNVAPADQPVADKLREALGAKSTKYFDRKSERAAVEKFYSARDYAPVFTQGGSATTALVKSVTARLKDAASDGLNAADYPVPDFAAATSPDALADAELKLTASMLDYARQAQSGRMHWSQVSADISYPEHPTDPMDVLVNVSTAKDPSAALESYNPPQKGFRDLKKKLAELRGLGEGAVAAIPEGESLRFSKKNPVVMEDPRVPQLRAKLGITENADDTHYDAKVADAVRRFQENADLKPTGVLDDRTVAALNAPKRDRQIDTVLVNMERWRWLPRDLGAPSIGDAYVILNIPDYTLKVMQHGAQVWTTKVVTGKPGIHATPLLTETMKFITVNPTWNVPPSIIYNEYLPALQQDPTVLERMGLKLERARDGSIHISQPPGEANALGRIRFNFPNKFLVYQHDTPDKNLFAKEERAFSHGCMRVQNPDQYASVLLNITEPNEHYTPEKIRGLYGHSEIDLKFPTPIPVNITYQTAFVDDAGKLQLRKDVYGRDATMLAMLHNVRGRDLENVIAHAQPSYTRPKSDIPEGVAFNDNGFGNGPINSGPPSFFARLFGAPPPPTPPQYLERRRRIFSR
jgi:murein L,D-transpeptidase YcbB/YkuD